MARITLPPALTLAQAARLADRSEPTVFGWLKENPDLWLITEPVRLIDAAAFAVFMDQRSKRSKTWDDRPTTRAPRVRREVGDAAD